MSDTNVPPQWNNEAENENFLKTIKEFFLCRFCKTLATGQVHQCVKSHIFCARCFKYLCENAVSKANIKGRCSECDVNILFSAGFRNLQVEQTIAEMQEPCKYCQVLVCLNVLKEHEANDCPSRPIKCKYALLGCKWMGSKEVSAGHEDQCMFPKKTGKELMEFVKPQIFDDYMVHESRLKNFLKYGTVLSCNLELFAANVSYKKITFNKASFRGLAQLWCLNVAIVELYGKRGDSNILRENEAAMIEGQNGEGEWQQVLLHQLELLSAGDFEPMMIKYLVQKVSDVGDNDNRPLPDVYRHVFKKDDTKSEMGYLMDWQNIDGPVFSLPLEKIPKVELRIHLSLVKDEEKFFDKV